MARLHRLLRRSPAVGTAWLLAGDADLLVLVSCRDLTGLQQLLARLRGEGGGPAPGESPAGSGRRRRPDPPRCVDRRAAFSRRARAAGGRAWARPGAGSPG
ncbi:Lrp/AsnC ligand binding domain-containing protein [Dactylosporangium sp. CS-047395]|uniref:Lrp/AsnC ligand binding domain-containing protein n=1 Tax=Dactylosporangium sp. CS-047395 TaxID=3239936 RepID=UPI003D8FC64A